MGVATTAAPYGFWATNPTKKLAHWVYLLGQPLSRNRVFQNFSGEPPPPPPPLNSSTSQEVAANIPEVHLNMVIDLRQFINLSPYTCNETVSFARIFNLFRSMGLRYYYSLDKRTINSTDLYIVLDGQICMCVQCIPILQKISILRLIFYIYCVQKCSKM